MNTLMKSCKTAFAATALSMVFSPVVASSSDAVPQVAQAQSSASASQGAASGSNSGTPAGNTADTTSSSSGETSGASNASGDSASSGQSGQQSGSAASGKGASAKSGSAKTDNAKAPVYLLVPVDVANNESTMKNGCWAKLYSRENYGGDMLTLVGPTTLPDMDSTGFFGLNWDDRVESVELGPKAVMTVYDNENYRDQVGQFKAGQRVADISKRVGLFDEFASLRIDCQQG